MPGRDIFSVIGAWEDWMLARDLSPATRRNYVSYLFRAGGLRRKDPRAFTREDVTAVMKHFQPQGPARGMAIQAMRSFFRWAQDEEMLVDPARDMRVHRPDPGPAPWLEPEQIRALLRAAFAYERDRPPTRRRRGWAIMLLYATAGRRASITDLRREDCRADSVIFRTMKGGGAHEVPVGRMGQVALAHLLAYDGRRSRPTLLGVGEGMVWRWVREAARDADVRYGDRFAWPHLLRHTAGTVAYEGTLDHIGVADFLGHKGLAHVRRYTGRANPRKRRVAEAIGGGGSA